jgi:hypothetical protein
MVCSELDVDDHIVKVAFRKFDRHGSGNIVPGDLRNILGSSFQGEDLESLIREADQNCDGKLDFCDFQNYIYSNRSRLLDTKARLMASKDKEASEVPPSRPPVLLGNQSGPVGGNVAINKGPQKGLPFANNVSCGLNEVQLSEVQSTKRTQPPACCVVQ